MTQQNLDLFPVGNCSVSALIDRRGRFVWACAPRVDGDPVFSALMDGMAPEHGFWAIEMEDVKSIDDFWRYCAKDSAVTYEIKDRIVPVLEADGLLAVCVQHEMDHLMGKVFVEYLSPLKRNRIKTKMIKAKREESR